MPADTGTQAGPGWQHGVQSGELPTAGLVLLLFQCDTDSNGLCVIWDHNNRAGAWQELPNALGGMISTCGPGSLVVCGPASCRANVPVPLLLLA